MRLHEITGSYRAGISAKWVFMQFLMFSSVVLVLNVAYFMSILFPESVDFIFGVLDSTAQAGPLVSTAPLGKFLIRSDILLHFMAGFLVIWVTRVWLKKSRVLCLVAVFGLALLKELFDHTAVMKSGLFYEPFMDIGFTLLGASLFFLVEWSMIMRQAESNS